MSTIDRPARRAIATFVTAELFLITGAVAEWWMTGHPS